MLSAKLKIICTPFIFELKSKQKNSELIVAQVLVFCFPQALTFLEVVGVMDVQVPASDF